MNNIKKLLSVGFLVIVAGCTTANVGTTNNTSTQETKSVASTVNLESVSVVYFDFDRSSIKATEVQKLDSQAIWMQDNSNAKITIEGHTDYLGTREYNLALGERRATASKNYLVKKGIKSDRISVVSYGKDKQVDSNQTDEARAKNRRTVSIIAK